MEERAERTERLGFRVTRAQKAVLAKAAALAGEDVTSFVLTRALHDARNIVQTDQVTVIASESRAAYEAWLSEEGDAIPEMEKRLAHVEPFPFAER